MMVPLSLPPDQLRLPLLPWPHLPTPLALSTGPLWALVKQRPSTTPILKLSSGHSAVSLIIKTVSSMLFSSYTPASPTNSETKASWLLLPLCRLRQSENQRLRVAILDMNQPLEKPQILPRNQSLSRLHQPQIITLQDSIPSMILLTKSKTRSQVTTKTTKRSVLVGSISKLRSKMVCFSFSFGVML
jgi:hypothetical protein